MNDLFVKEPQPVKNRFTILYIVIFGIFGVLLTKLFSLQVVEGNEHLALSSIIKTSESIIRAPRGLIYDRNGEILAKNDPSFNLIVDLYSLPPEREEGVIQTLSGILDVDYDLLWQDYYARVYDEAQNRKSLSQITLISNISRDAVVSISSRSEELPGVYVEVGTIRNYVYGNDFAHVLGYVREASESDLETGNFTHGDITGAIGLEQYYDSTLRGANGRRVVETDRNESMVRELIPIDAVPGKSIQISINYQLQQKLTEYLQDGIDRNNAGGGGAVIMDIHSGEIISMVSLPTYDPNAIIRGLSHSEAQALQEDTRSPFSNRIISFAEPPGSIFKTIVASSALQEGVITPQTEFESTGCMDLAEGYEFCEAGKQVLGKLDLLHGISRSSNIYFCNTSLRLGIDNLDKYAESFNLGKPTGVDLVGEAGGVMASRDEKLESIGEPWYYGDTCNTAIGQGLMRTTPLQAVGWVSTIANGGTYYKPHLMIKILDGDTVEKTIDPEVLYEVPIEERHFETVREGMHLAVNDPWGSAFSLRGLRSDVAAKTGSAETVRKVNGVFEKSAHSWITGFYPYEDPQYAFVIYLEYGGWGFRSGEVMKDFLTWYENDYLNQ